MTIERDFEQFPARLKIIALKNLCAWKEELVVAVSLEDLQPRACKRQRQESKAEQAADGCTKHDESNLKDEKEGEFAQDAGVPLAAPLKQIDSDRGSEDDDDDDDELDEGKEDSDDSDARSSPERDSTPPSSAMVAHDGSNGEGKCKEFNDTLKSTKCIVASGKIKSASKKSAQMFQDDLICMLGDVCDDGHFVLSDTKKAKAKASDTQWRYNLSKEKMITPDGIVMTAAEFFRDHDLQKTRILGHSITKAESSEIIIKQARPAVVALAKTDQHLCYGLAANLTAFHNKFQLAWEMSKTTTEDSEALWSPSRAVLIAKKSFKVGRVLKPIQKASKSS